MDNELLNKKYFTPSEVAELLMVSPITVRLWSQRGELESISTPGGHRRYLYQHIVAFAKERNLPIDLKPKTGIRVLIVDDDEQLTHYLRELLNDYPGVGEIKIASDGFKAGSLIYTFEPHVILLDLKMPHMNGFEVCSDLKRGQMTKDIRVIAMSGYYSKENIAKIMEAGAEVFLKKPFEPEELYKVMGLDVMRNE